MSVQHAEIMSVKDESFLYIYNVTKRDEGLYACVSGNSLGTTMANATLTVNEFLGISIPTGEEEPEYSYLHLGKLAPQIVKYKFGAL